MVFEVQRRTGGEGVSDIGGAFFGGIHAGLRAGSADAAQAT